MDIRDSSCVDVSPSVVFTDLDDGTGVLLELKSKIYFSLNETGTFVWQIVEEDKEATIRTMAEKMCEEFEIDPAAATRDVYGFLARLAGEGLIAIRT